jgi:hypothetical protein
MTAMTLNGAEGSCLCGRIRFRLEGEVTESGYCHCRTCQKQSGAPVVAWFAMAPSGFRYVTGTPKSFRASDRAAREFCGDCGTYLLFREDDPATTLGINTATLDNPELVPPDFHIWHASRIPWFETNDGFPRHPKGKI